MFAQYTQAARHRRLMVDYTERKEYYHILYSSARRGEFHRRFSVAFTEVEKQTFEDFSMKLHNERMAHDNINVLMRKIDDYRSGQNIILDDVESAYFFDFYMIMMELLEEVVPIEVQVPDMLNLTDTMVLETETKVEEKIIKEIANISTFQEIKDFVLVNRCKDIPQAVSFSMYMELKSVFCYDQMEVSIKGSSMMIDDLMTSYTQCQPQYFLDIIFPYLTNMERVRLRRVCKYATRIYKNHVKRFYGPKVLQLVLGNSSVDVPENVMALVNSKYKSRIYTKKMFGIEAPLENCDLSYIMQQDNIDPIYEGHFVKLMEDLKERMEPESVRHMFGMPRYKIIKNFSIAKVLKIKLMSPYSNEFNKIDHYKRLNFIVRLERFIALSILHRYTKTTQERLDFMSHVLYYRGMRGISEAIKEYDPWKQREKDISILPYVNYKTLRALPYHEYAIKKIENKDKFSLQDFIKRKENINSNKMNVTVLNINDQLNSVTKFRDKFTNPFF
jgi:hypothetical protein